MNMTQDEIHLQQIKSHIRLWILMDMIDYEVSHFIGMDDKYIEKHRKIIQKELNGLLKHINNKYHLKSERALHDWTAEVYDLFLLQTNMGQEKLTQLKEISESMLSVVGSPTVEEEHPVQSS